MNNNKKIDTPRGTFILSECSEQQLRNNGFGYHHCSDNGKYNIMSNGTIAVAIRRQ